MTDNDIKYKAIFGDMAQFNGMMPGCVFISGEYGYKIVEDTLYYCERYNERYGWTKSCVALEDFRPIAMREPVSPKPTWTKADREKGVLPPIGVEIQHVISKKPVDVLLYKNDVVVLCAPYTNVVPFNLEKSALLNLYEPIETPREKYDRERDECIDKLLAKIPPSPINVVLAMKIVYEEIRPFTGDDHD